jgi:hypothetical protein
MVNNELEYLVDTMVEYGICNDDEVRLVSAINGYSMESMLDILFARTGYRSLEQFFDSIDD